MTQPPFRADHVGSFLRPERLRAAREQFFAKALPADELRAVEDACIREVVRAQENVGLKGITDGEFRRAYFHTDFLLQLDGVGRPAARRCEVPQARRRTWLRRP